MEIFFATTALKKDTGVDDPAVKPRPVRAVGVLGGGLMGSGISFVTVNAGVPVRVRERDDAAAGKALASVKGLLDERVKRRSIDRLERDEKLRLLTATTDWSGFGAVDVLIEAVFEDLALKQQMVRAFEAVNPTRHLRLQHLVDPDHEDCRGLAHPETVLGMHYFSPVQKMPLLEVIVTEQTVAGGDGHRGRAREEAGQDRHRRRRRRRASTRAASSRPYMNEAAQLLVEGAAIEDLDRALVQFGFPVGPITLLDEVGIDVGEKVGKILHDAFGDADGAAGGAATTWSRRAASAGRTGRASTRTVTTRRRSASTTTVYDLLPGGRSRKALRRRTRSASGWCCRW